MSTVLGDTSLLGMVSFSKFLLGSFMMRKRFKMSRRGSRRHFTKNALRTNPRNVQQGLVMRGGIRL